MEEFSAEQIILRLSKCRQLVNKSCTNLQKLNDFCMEFLQLSEELHRFLAHVNAKELEIIYLCLTQILACIKNMERTIKAEVAQGITILAARQHFLDRIHWCLERLSCIIRLQKSVECKTSDVSEDSTFVDLMDVVLDQLSPYTSYKDSSVLEKQEVIAAKDQAQAFVASKQIRSNVDLILSHTLAFANVALKQDKKALSALCQKVLRECMSFQEECAQTICLSDSNRKIKGISLENALYQLEDFINEALLRLVFTCFLDYNKLSVAKLRAVIREKDADDPELDELIADFDVNIDRTTQIGMFAIAFAANVKIKTIVRSCLASFESLDSCIIPSLQTKTNSNMYAVILEQHFNDEVENFKQAIQEIIDSHAFTSCYYDLLNQTIKCSDKEYNKQSLVDIIEMGDFLHDHFQLSVNQKELRQHGDRMELFKKFTLMLRECQAILKCSDKEQVHTQRILKRFKILRSILRKLIDELGGKTLDGNPLSATRSQVFLMSDELSDSQRMFASIGVFPSIRSILYSNSPTMDGKRRLRQASDSLKANYSKLPLLSPPPPPPSTPPPTHSKSRNKPQTINSSNIMHKISTNPVRSTTSNLQTPHINRLSIRRKESLRKAMFKRETEELYGMYKNNSGSLQISEILDQLNSFSTSLNESILDKSIISN